MRRLRSRRPHERAVRAAIMLSWPPSAFIRQPRSIASQKIRKRVCPSPGTPTSARPGAASRFRTRPGSLGRRRGAGRGDRTADSPHVTILSPESCSRPAPDALTIAGWHSTQQPSRGAFRCIEHSKFEPYPRSLRLALYPAHVKTPICAAAQARKVTSVGPTCGSVPKAQRARSQCACARAVGAVKCDLPSPLPHALSRIPLRAVLKRAPW